jgi:protein-tyrosine phosphatase
MLKSAASQKVDLMIATPHFYASRNTVDAFLRHRTDSYEKLTERIRAYGEAALPQIRLGAEVAYFDGISKADRIGELTIQGTDLLLLELPFSDWDARVVREVRHLIEKRSFRVILAHLERFMGSRANKQYIQELLELPVLVQINAEAFTPFLQRQKLVRMFASGEAHLLGSDCHGMGHRPPNLAAGRQILRKRCGQAILDQIDERGAGILEERG